MLSMLTMAVLFQTTVCSYTRDNQYTIRRIAKQAKSTIGDLSNNCASCLLTCCVINHCDKSITTGINIIYLNCYDIIKLKPIHLHYACHRRSSLHRSRSRTDHVTGTVRTLTNRTSLSVIAPAGCFHRCCHDNSSLPTTFYSLLSTCVGCYPLDPLRYCDTSIHVFIYSVSLQASSLSSVN